MSLRVACFAFLAPALLAQEAAPSVSEEAEAAIGAAMARHFRERHVVLDAPQAQAYLDRIVNKVAASQSGDGPCCTVELYSSDDAYAKPTAFPGGYLFVPSKLFFTSLGEDVFVSSIAHAVAHIRLRDWTADGQFGSIPLTFVWTEDDRIESVPLGMRPAFEARERRANAAAAQSVYWARADTGEFERIRGALPPPAPRPSLLR